MKTDGIINIVGLVLLAVGIGFAIEWPWGLVALGAGLYADSLMGSK